MLRGKPLSGASDPRLYFIGDKQDSVFPANFLKELEEIPRRHDKAAFAQNWLRNHGGDRLRRDARLNTSSRCRAKFSLVESFSAR